MVLISCCCGYYLVLGKLNVGMIETLKRVIVLEQKILRKEIFEHLMSNHTTIIKELRINYFK